MSSKKEKTRQNIIDAFWSLYETTRIEKITVKDICLKASINRSTFYEYFTDVYAVLEAIEDWLLPNLDELPQVLINGEPFGMSELEHLAYFKEKKKYLKVLLSKDGNPAFVHKLKMILKPSFLHLFEDKGKSKEFDYMLEFILSGMIGVMSYHIQNDEPLDDLVVMDTIKSLSTKLNIISNK